MYSTPYACVLEFRPRPSRSLGAWLVTGHVAAGTCLAMAGAGLAGLVVVCLLPFSLRRALAPMGPRVLSVTWSPGQGWRRHERSGQYIPMELRPSSVVTTGALFLHWSDARGGWRVLLPADALGAEAFRRMAVIARFHDAGRTHC